MAEYSYDAVIIGGGISGLMASIYLAGKGFKTALVSRGDPVCCLSTGCIDILAEGNDPIRSMDRLPRDHPYRLMDTSLVVEAMDLFMGIMAQQGLPYSGSIHKNRFILTPIGTAKKTCLVPVTMEASLADRGDHVHVISFKGIKDFFPSHITSRLPHTSVSIYDAGVSSTTALATLFDEPSFVDDFCQWAAALELPPGKVAFPAVLGLKNPRTIVETLSRKLGRDVFEIPTLPPSIPGMRLFRALKAALQNRGGHTYWGNPVASVEMRSGVVEALTFANPCRPSRLHGRAFILATGSFVGGGLFATRTSVQETVFNLPVFTPGPRKEWFLGDFFTPGHPIEASGIEVDGLFKPARARIENLFVCGSILAHSEIMKYRCGHGLAITTGVAAARSCERMLS